MVSSALALILLGQPQLQARKLEARKRGLAGIFGAQTVEIVNSGINVSASRSASGTPAVTPSPTWIKRFRAAMSNPDHHSWLTEYKCGFNPGVFIKFEKAGQIAEVQFCFHCSEISLLGPDARGGKKQAVTRAGRRAFLLLFRDIFPKDAALAALPLDIAGLPDH